MRSLSRTFKFDIHHGQHYYNLDRISDHNAMNDGKQFHEHDILYVTSDWLLPDQNIHHRKIHA